MGEADHAFRDRILDQSVNGIYIHDLLQRRNVYINRQYTELTGYAPEDVYEMTGEVFFSLFHPEDRPRILSYLKAVAHAIDIDTPLEITHRLKKADGTWMWCFSKVTVFDRDMKGAPTQFMGSFIDITTEKECERQLQEAQVQLAKAKQELSQFSYLASHDLQSPLRTIKNYIGLVLEEYDELEQEEIYTFLGIADQAATRMHELINAIMRYARIGQAQHLSRMDCTEIVQDVLLDFKPLIAESNADVTVYPLPTIEGYIAEVELVFKNLISNALTYRQADVPPQIAIRAEEKPDEWVFSVSDNGIGIDPKFKEKVFSIFGRLHSHHEYPGTGIGLAHCRKILDLHKGKLWFESAPNQGSTFHFSIPKNITP